MCPVRRTTGNGTARFSKKGGGGGRGSKQGRAVRRGGVKPGGGWGGEEEGVEDKPVKVALTHFTWYGLVL